MGEIAAITSYIAVSLSGADRRIEATLAEYAKQAPPEIDEAGHERTYADWSAQERAERGLAELMRRAEMQAILWRRRAIEIAQTEPIADQIRREFDLPVD